MWLKCGYTNHLPGVIAGYYMECIEKCGGCPSKVRTDCGTENVLVAAIQCTLANSDSAHVYGTSPANQRIESWWSFFRRSRAQWWIELFESLVSAGVFQPGHLRQTDCLRFCFMSVIRDDLEFVQQIWNTHRIRPSRGATCPAGIPDELYFLPIPPGVDCLIHASTVLPPQIQLEIQPSCICEDSAFEDYLEYLCQLHNWHAPHSIDDATHLYYRLFPFL